MASTTILRTPTFKRVQLARTTLLMEHPFFGVLSLGLELKEDPGCQTAWTDGRSLGFDPAFVTTLTDDQLVGLIAHEVMHCACGHPWRRDNRDSDKWNRAADYAINHVIREAGLALPESALLDAAFAGKWAEWIYDRLPDNPPQGQQQGQQPGQGSGAGQQSAPSFGEVRDAPADSTAPTEAEWQQLTKQATKAARGNLPASMRREIDALMRPRVDWRSLLRRYLQELTRADYCWSRPNTRYLPSGLYLPALHSHEMGRIAIAVDTSGSIDAVLLSQFAAEIDAIARDMQPSRVDVLYCDAEVHRTDTFERGDTITMQPCGGGGTNFAPVFDALQEDPPVVLVYLTDLEGRFPDAAPEYPVIWAVYGGKDTAPFGDVVPCD